MINNTIYRENLEYFADIRKDDQMTPIERSNALAKGEEVDRMPVQMMADLVLPDLIGTTLKESELSAKSKAELQIAAYHLFGFDGIGMMHGLYSLPMAMGGKYTESDHMTKSLTEPPIKDIHDFSGLDLDCIKLENDDAAYKAFDAIRYIQDAVGDEITCGMNFTAPFTVATGVVGVEPFLTACAREPEIAFQVLDFVVQAQCKLAKSFLEAGITVGTSDPVASCTVINPKMYRKYAKPYEMKFAEFCSSYTGRPMSIHICGNTTKILKDVANAGFVTFSLDNMVDLEVAKEKIGDQVHLVGNVDPVAIMMQATPDEVRADVRKCYRKAWDSPKGFTIHSGCDMPYGTPKENMKAYLDEAKKCAKEQAHAYKNPKEHHIWDEK